MMNLFLILRGFLTPFFLGIAACSAFFLLAGEAYGFSGKVIKVIDGDTLVVATECDARRIVRLAGIDAPEIGQAQGRNARDFLESMVARKTIHVRETGTDRYGRTLGVALREKLNINSEMIRRGYAWVYKRYSHDKLLLLLETGARMQKRGLWASNNPIPPWDWRHARKNSTLKRSH